MDKDFSLESDRTAVKLFAIEKFGSLAGLAKAIGISPQNLNSHLKSGSRIGIKLIEKLAGVGFDASHLSGMAIATVSKENSLLTGEPSPLYLDIAGAVELTRSPAKRLAQLIQVAPGTLEAWETGEASPTIAQLGALLNQVVALGLARCAEHDRRPAVQEERRAAAG